MNFREIEWDSFSNIKSMAHYERWKTIERGKEVAPPVLVTIDSSNMCNLNCKWCNANSVRKNSIISHSSLMKIADFLCTWKDSNNLFDVKAICIAGGGEPLLNPFIGEFISVVTKHKECSVVTNGLLINNFLHELLLCKYVAVSVDAGSKETFNKLKGLSSDDESFDKIISNIKKLVKMSKENKCELSKEGFSFGVNYRMLLYKDNIGEIVKAAEIAKSIGCKNFHVRPATIPWNEKKENIYTKSDLELFKEQIQIAKKLEDDSFHVKTTLFKFNSDFKTENDFEKCHAIFMTMTIMPPDIKADKDSINVNVCCDRRADKSMNLLTNETNISYIKQMWGSDKHWNIFDLITEDEIKNNCPRCTYYQHNVMFDNTVFNDNMLVNFI